MEGKLTFSFFIIFHATKIHKDMKNVAEAKRFTWEIPLHQHRRAQLVWSLINFIQLSLNLSSPIKPFFSYPLAD